jgi:hypothetical protein
MPARRAGPTSAISPKYLLSTRLVINTSSTVSRAMGSTAGPVTSRTVVT